MHSSRMRTGQTLTVFWCLVPGGGGEGVSPKKAEIKKKFQKEKKLGVPLNPPLAPSTPLNHTPLNHTPPKKIGDPQKIGDP